MAGDDETLLNKTVTTSRGAKEIKIPKLRSNSLDDYRRWKRDVDLWMELTKIEKSKQASHIILSGIEVEVEVEVKDVVSTIEKSSHTTDNGMTVLLQVLDKHFMPNTFSRKIEVWKNLIKTGKTENTTWTELTRRIMKMEN